MKTQTVTIGFSYFLSLLVFILFWSHIGAGNDIIWLMHCAHEMLSGKSNYTDYFETNPPLIIWFNIPAVFLGYLFHLSDKTAYFLWVILITTAILFWIDHGLKRYFKETSFPITYLMCLLSFVFIVMPFTAFGERDILSVLFIFPYCFIIILRLSHQKIHFTESFFSGLLVAIGTAFKPYFLFSLLFIELFYFIKVRSLKKYIRPEIIIAFLAMLIYVFSIFIVDSNYFTHVFPLVTALYIPAFNRAPLHYLIMNQLVLPMIPVLSFTLFYTIFHPKDAFFQVFCLANFGFFMSFLMAGQPWYYHLCPTFMLSFFLLSYVAYQKIIKPHWFELVKFFCVILLMMNTLYFGVYGAEFTIKQFPNDAKSTLHQVAYFLKHHVPPGPVLLIDNLIDQPALMTLSGRVATSRFPSMVLVPGLKKLELDHERDKYHRFKKQFFDMVMEDIQKRPPIAVIFYQPDYFLYSHTQEKFVYHSYKRFFNSDLQFQDFFKHYHLVKVIDGVEIYVRA